MVTKNRRHKAAIRARTVETGAAYMVARRQLDTPEPSAPASTDAVPAGVEILPPLKDWTRPSYCRFWAEKAAEHGPLTAVVVSSGPRWSELDDLVRDAAGQNRPTEQRDLWISFGGRFFVTKREHLPAIAAALDAEDALSRLVVRAVPDAAHCDHPTCRRRRGEPPVPPKAPPRIVAPRTSTVFGPMLGLAEAMEQHPELSYAGIGIDRQRAHTPAGRRAELARERMSLVEREDSVLEIAACLRANIAPIKPPRSAATT